MVSDVPFVHGVVTAIVFFFVKQRARYLLSSDKPSGVLQTS